MRVLAALFALAALAGAQTAKIERHGNSSTISVHTFRPVHEVAAAMESQFGEAVGAEDPMFSFTGDMIDLSREEPRVRPGTLVPARWGFEVSFPVRADGSPQDLHALLVSIVAAANAKSGFGWRLDETDGAYEFVPTRTHDAQGNSIAMTPLLDRTVTIPRGVRALNESAHMMAEELSRQTGLRVSCCQSVIAGYPWGMEQVSFGATNERARDVLPRLGLNHWYARCDRAFCFIEMR